MARRRAVCGKLNLTDGITVGGNDLAGDAPTGKSGNTCLVLSVKGRDWPMVL